MDNQEMSKNYNESHFFKTLNKLVFSRYPKVGDITDEPANGGLVTIAGMNSTKLILTYRNELDATTQVSYDYTSCNLKEAELTQVSIHE